MSSIITTSPPGEKPGKSLTLWGSDCKKTFTLKEIGKGNVIELPADAQVGRRAFLKYPQPGAVWSITVGISSATVLVCPPEWYRGLALVEQGDGFEADEMAYRCCNEWLMPLKYDGWIKRLALTVDEYLEVSHAAA